MANATVPPDPIAETLAMLWSPVLAITTHHQGRNNGLAATTGVVASLVPEAPRVVVELAKASLTHNLVLASRVFALHTGARLSIASSSSRTWSVRPWRRTARPAAAFTFRTQAASSPSIETRYRSRSRTAITSGREIGRPERRPATSSVTR
jgi:hypothetical protein